MHRPVHCIHIQVICQIKTKVLIRNSGLFLFAEKPVIWVLSAVLSLWISFIVTVFKRKNRSKKLPVFHIRVTLKLYFLSGAFGCASGASNLQSGVFCRNRRCFLCLINICYLLISHSLFKIA